MKCSIPTNTGKISSWEGWSGIGTAAQGRGGITIPGNDQKACGCGTWGHGLVVGLVVVMGGCLDLMISEIFSNLNDSMVCKVEPWEALGQIPRPCTRSPLSNGRGDSPKWHSRDPRSCSVCRERILPYWDVLGCTLQAEQGLQNPTASQSGSC